MRIENTNIYNMAPAVKGMRYSYSSEDKSDSTVVLSEAKKIEREVY